MVLNTETQHQNISQELCECMQNCNIKNLIINKCTNISFKGDGKNGFISAIINDILKGNVQRLLKEGNGNIVFTNDNNIHQLSQYSFQKTNLNLSSLDLGECEAKIKNKTNINSTEDLFIYIIEHKLDEIKIPILEYVLFTENEDNIIVDLSICNNMNIQHQIPISIKEEDIDKYNPSSEYYKDECNVYSNDNDVDMTLYERKNEFNENNMSLCEKDCDYIKYNKETKKAECNCAIKNEISFSKENINQGDLVGKINNNEKSSTNLKVTQCTNVFSSPEQIKSNGGFFLLLIILIAFIIIFIIFCTKGKNMLENTIDDIIHTQFEKNCLNKNKSILNNNKNINKNTIYNRNKGKKGKIKNKKEQSKTNSKNIMNSKSVNKDNSKKENPKKLITSDIININNNQNKSVKNKKIPKLNDYELNNLLYNEAINYDKRSSCEYYSALLKNKQLFMFTFCSFEDYNSGVIKKFIFFLSFALHYTVNALFFNDSNMHQIYEDEGSYNFSYQFPYIIISAVVSTAVLRLILETLVLTERSIVKLKKQNSYEEALNMKSVLMKNINIKFAIFFIVNFILLVAFWYYLTCFNAVYNNTQIYLIENTFISFGISLFFPVFYNIIPTCLRKCALSSENKDSDCLYTTSKIFQMI